MAEGLFELPGDPAPARRGGSLADADHTSAPLAVRMRPRSLDELVGQQHLLAPGSPLRRLVEGDQPMSLLLWGPPGTGKTTIAAVVSHQTNRKFVELSAVTAGVKDVRQVIDAARRELSRPGRSVETVLFIDEVHRFTKAQQDALLPGVENRWVTLVAATTENPFFSVISPLLSRSLLLTLESLTDEDIAVLLDRALTDERGLGDEYELAADAKDHLLRMAGGDARRALTYLEAAAGGAKAKAAAQLANGGARSGKAADREPTGQSTGNDSGAGVSAGGNSAAAVPADGDSGAGAPAGGGSAAAVPTEGDSGAGVLAGGGSAAAVPTDGDSGAGEPGGGGSAAAVPTDGDSGAGEPGGGGSAAAVLTDGDSGAGEPGGGGSAAAVPSGGGLAVGESAGGVPSGGGSAAGSAGVGGGEGELSGGEVGGGKGDGAGTAGRWRIPIDLETLETAVDRAAVRYDRAGDQHYDVTSAMIKSIRGSDVDAAMHYLARMVEAGEDPRFIARRLVISASEDIGMGDPTALGVAIAAAEAVQLIGMPEARINLAQAVVALALAPKSNAVILAIDAAIADVKAGKVGPVPPHLRDTHYAGAKKLGHGSSYQYSHNDPRGVVPQQYAPDVVDRVDYYQPNRRGGEAAYADRVAAIRKILRDRK